MSKVIELNNATVYSGDNREILKTLADNSIDSIVTDPPYELGFMNKGWDKSGIAYDVELWRECLRVLKPGGHLLAFGGSRTWHRLAVAVEDAGFDIRDSIAWIYGSGFPKSLNVSKAVDDLRAKQSANVLLPEEKLFCDWMKEYSGFTEAKCKELLGSARFITGEVEIVNTATKENPRMGRRAMVPTSAAWEKIKPLLANTPPDWVEELVKEPPKPGITHPGDWKSGKGEGTTGENEWDGWGTALKPAFEPIVVARKPLIGTVAENVLEFGTGGINIDASRIGTETISVHNAPTGSFAGGEQDRGSDTDSYREHIGRWPANVILDETTAQLLDEQSGISKSTPLKGNTDKSKRNAMSGGSMFSAPSTHNDFGGASRFFYVAKANKRDRNEGLDQLPIQRPDTRTSTSMGTFEEKGVQPQRNFHPTVKPTQLMRYLIKLVTPPNGIVLDPFTGSGSTGKAAILDNYQFIGIELTEEYFPIIEGRLRHAQQTLDNKADDLFE